jgi:hypothetical protein
MNEDDRSAAVLDLRHAAERVRWAGKRARQGPWFVQPDNSIGGWAATTSDSRTPEQGAPVILSFASEQDARWAAKVSPHIAVPLAQLFEEAASWLEHDSATDTELKPIVKMALPLAWAILRTNPRPVYDD